MRSKSVRLFAIFLVSYTVLFYIWLCFYSGSLAVKIKVSDVLQTIPPFISSIMLFKAWKISKPRDKSFWLLLALGCTSYIIAQLGWDYHEVVLGVINPSYNWSGLTWIFSAICFVAALFFKTAEKADKDWALLLLMDTLIMMCIAVAITWVYMILPNYYKIYSTDMLDIISFGSYLIINLISLFVSVNLYLTIKPNDPERKTFYLVTLAFLIMFVTNLVYCFLTITNAYSSDSLIAPFWSLYLLILALATIEYKSAVSSSSVHAVSEEMQGKEEQFVGNRYENALILISVILLFTFMWIYNSKVVWICSAASIVLITMRHNFTINQNKQLIKKLRNLNETLELKVEERTKELYNIAYYDQLTGLPNRRMFEDRLKQVLSSPVVYNHSIALMLLDLDRFKNINDTLGHSFGDALLKEVSRRLTKCLTSKSIISRQGGDEFAILIEHYNSLEELEHIASCILEEMVKPIELVSHYTYITCSIGIVLYSESNKDAETLMRRADAAMYRSKELGKNTYQFYTPEMDSLSARRLNLEKELRRAIENNEFRLYFQPQVNSSTGEIVGSEALIRWVHPKKGIISPSEFIPLAEDTGLIALIDSWVIKTACHQAKQWQLKGYKHLKMGVNVSPFLFKQDHFLQLIKNCLSEAELEPSCLVVEITENISLQQEDNACEKLKELKDLGVSISIDDFGTGYSSLSYLSSFPVDTLKIAQQFVKAIKEDPNNKAIISAIIAVAQNLKLGIIAEGVENKEELDFLNSQNCFYIQGYYYGKPAAAEDFERHFLKEKEPYKLTS